MIYRRHGFLSAARGLALGDQPSFMGTGIQEVKRYE